jgi:hypothetical protein
MDDRRARMATYSFRQSALNAFRLLDRLESAREGDWFERRRHHGTAHGDYPTGTRGRHGVDQRASGISRAGMRDREDLPGGDV